MDAAVGGVRLPAGFTLVLTLLIGAVPLFGIYALGWSVWSVMLLFWVENLLGGVITLVRLLICSPGDGRLWAAKLFLLPFFTAHYGLFCVVHLVFLLVLFGPGPEISGSPWDQLPRVHQLLFAQPDLLWCSVLVALGLLLRMLLGYVLNGAYRSAAWQEEMFAPYRRVLVLHMSIIAGGVLLLALGVPQLGVVVLVVLKLALELGFWRLDAAEPSPAQPTPNAPN